MAGAAFSYPDPRLVMKLIRAAMDLTTTPKAAMELGSGLRRPLEMAGVPTSDYVTAPSELPDGIGQLCYDSTNDDVYLCTAWVSVTSFTWLKIN